MIRKLAVVNLVLLSILLASAVVNVWTRDGIAQSVSGFTGFFSSFQLQALNPTIGAPNGPHAIDISIIAAPTRSARSFRSRLLRTTLRPDRNFSMGTPSIATPWAIAPSGAIML
jgi:hypothetical protein